MSILKIAAWIFAGLAFWQLFKAWPYMRKLQKVSMFGYVFPTQKMRGNPDFNQMWKHLGAFYGFAALFISLSLFANG